MSATYHSVKRLTERCGLPKRSACRQIGKAMAEGRRAEDFSSWERNYLHAEGHDALALAYNGYCYIIKDEKCLTVHALPVWFGKPKHFSGKERIRDYKKFQRYIPMEDCI